MAEGGGGGEAGEEGPRAVGPRPPSARDLQVRRTAGRGRGVGDGAAGACGTALAAAELPQTGSGTEL